MSPGIAEVHARHQGLSTLERKKPITNHANELESFPTATRLLAPQRGIVIAEERFEFIRAIRD
jgi:hypothetical protein